MYKELVNNLTIDNLGLELKVLDNNIIKSLEIENPIIEDYLYPITDTIEPFMPDYAVRGYFKHIDHYHMRSFIIDSSGPDLLTVTGVEKNYIEPYIISEAKERLFTHYWEDSKIGYLTQVLKI